MSNVNKPVCHYCGGYGKEGGCPKCGLTPHKSMAIKSMSLDVPVDMIPVTYQGKVWERPPATEGMPQKFMDFDTKAEKIATQFAEGKVPSFSVMMCTPPKYGKHAFAFYCMQSAILQSFTVAPLLSTSDWRRLYKVSQMNPFYKLYDKYTWDNLISRDVVFLYVDHSDDRFDVIGLLKDILDIRAGFNKPTFIMSDYKLNELVPRWGSETYSMIHNVDPNRDYFRYPVILHRFE